MSQFKTEWWLSLHNVWRYEFQGDGMGTVNLGVVIAYMSGMEID